MNLCISGSRRRVTSSAWPIFSWILRRVCGCRTAAIFLRSRRARSPVTPAGAAHCVVGKCCWPMRSCGTCSGAVRRLIGCLSEVILKYLVISSCSFFACCTILFQTFVSMHRSAARHCMHKSCAGSSICRRPHAHSRCIVCCAPTAVCRSARRAAPLINRQPPPLVTVTTTTTMTPRATHYAAIASVSGLDRITCAACSSCVSILVNMCIVQACCIDE